MADPAVLKQVKIKTGVLKRLIKEYSLYVKEADTLDKKAEEMKANATNEDEQYAAKKATEVAQESRGMISNTARRRDAALAELKNLLDANELGECQELADAEEQIAAAIGAV